MNKKLAYIVLGIIFISIKVIVFMIPNSLHLFGFYFSTKKFYTIITFMFCHITIRHLVLNLIGFVLSLSIFYCYDLKASYYLIVYFVSSLFSVFFWALLLRNVVFFGASAGIYGSFGYVSLKKKLLEIPRIFLFLLFLVSIYIDPVVSYILKLNTPNINQIFVHTLALFFGALCSLILKNKKI